MSVLLTILIVGWFYFGVLSCREIMRTSVSDYDGILIAGMLPMGLFGWLLLKAIQRDMRDYD